MSVYATVFVNWCGAITLRIVSHISVASMRIVYNCTVMDRVVCVGVAQALLRLRFRCNTVIV